MTRKLTKEEYQTIVDIVDEDSFDEKFLNVGASAVGLTWSRCLIALGGANKIRDLEQEVLLIILPKSREWAKEQFVEEEKKYYWELKPLFDDDDMICLTELKNGIIRYTTNGNIASPLTESKAREWGYNPDMFDREEVK